MLRYSGPLNSLAITKRRCPCIMYLILYIITSAIISKFINGIHLANFRN